MSLELRLKALTQRIGTEIKTIQAASDVVDVVGTKAALNSYDLTKLTDQDVVKVLADETLSDAQAYYRITKTSASTGSWTLVGSIAKFNLPVASSENLGGVKLKDNCIYSCYIMLQKTGGSGYTSLYIDTLPSEYQGINYFTNKPAFKYPERGLEYAVEFEFRQVPADDPNFGSENYGGTFVGKYLPYIIDQSGISSEQCNQFIEIFRDDRDDLTPPAGSVQLDQNNCAYVDLSGIQSDVSDLETAVGDTDQDLVSIFEASLTSA